MPRRTVYPSASGGGGGSHPDLAAHDALGLATQAELDAAVAAAVAALIDGSPGALNTLNELAAAINDDASFAAAMTTALALKAPIASPTFTGITTAPEFSASGLTGAVAASRYVGGTTSGAPASGTFAIGDFVIDQTGKIWICTVAGTPGTWVVIQSGATVASVDDATTARTLVLTDAGKVVRMTHASASTATVPPNDDVAFDVGTVINIYSAGAGGCTPTAGVGVTIRNNATALVQYKECSLRKDGTNEWVRLG